MIALDSNILIYAVLNDEPRNRNVAAQALLFKLAPIQPIVPLKVIGEFLNVCRRKKVLATLAARSRAGEFLDSFNCPVTTESDLISAVELSARYDLQFFDALIITVAARAGATMLLSEDMQDGLEVAGLRVVNPFAAANETLIADYFGSVV